MLPALSRSGVQFFFTKIKCPWKIPDLQCFLNLKVINTQYGCRERLYWANALAQGSQQMFLHIQEQYLNENASTSKCDMFLICFFYTKAYRGMNRLFFSHIHIEFVISSQWAVLCWMTHEMFGPLISSFFPLMNQLQPQNNWENTNY